MVIDIDSIWPDNMLDLSEEQVLYDDVFHLIKLIRRTAHQGFRYEVV